MAKRGRGAPRPIRRTGAPQQNPQLANAVRLHRAGNLGQAAALYRQVLAGDPRNAVVLRLLGEIEAQSGNTEAAFELIKRAVKRAPHDAEAHHSLGNLLLRMGRGAEAERVFRKALKLDGRHPGVLNNLGGLLIDRSRPREAEDLLAKAVAIAPRHALAHYNLGKARATLGEFERAETAYRQAMDLDPGFSGPLINLAVLKGQAGAFEEALALNERALGLYPRQGPEIRYNTSRLYRRLMRQEQGLEQLSRVLEVRPDFADAYVFRARLLMDLGRIDGAEAAARDALKVEPACAAAYFVLSEIKSFSRDDATIEAMKNLVKTGDLGDEDRIYLAFALAKALDDTGDMDAAFHHLHEGNRLKFRTFDYDRVAESAMCTAILERFAIPSPRGEVGSGNAPTPLFVIGLPRSGTTLIEQILAAHRDVTSCGELTLLDTLANGAAGMSASDSAKFQTLGDTYLDRVQSQFDVRTPFFTDKLPANFRHVGLIRQAFPGARIIHCTRAPMDTALSCYQRLFGEGMPWVYELEALAHFFGLYTRMMAAWHRCFPGEILDVSYEDIVTDIETGTRRLLDFCGLDWDDSCLSFYRNDNPVSTASNIQVRRPVHARSVGKWRRYEDHLRPLQSALEENGVFEP